MVILKPITASIVDQFRDLRLRALQDTPTAFTATYARESQLSSEDWLKRVRQWNGDRSATYLACDGDEACGIAAGFLDHDDPASAHLASMWTAPTHRRMGVGRSLVNAIVDWARSQRAATLCLTVTSNNDVARRFYEQLGFVLTGKAEPHSIDMTLFQLEMAKAINDAAI